MARMQFSGTEDVMRELLMENERMERKATEMLGEAGKVVTKALQDVIEERGHVDTGAMKESVRASAVKKSGSARVTTIYPHGKDAKGVRNAEKAYIIHYGTSKRRGDHFVDEAEERAMDAAEQTMQEVWERD